MKTISAILPAVDLLDAKGLVMHSYHRCSDKDSTLFNMHKEKTPRAEVAFGTVVTGYLLDILENNAPQNIIAVWEGGNDRRIAMFPTYKAKRKARVKDPVVEEQLKKLTKYVKDFLAGLGAVQVQVPSVEGDDVIAMLSERLGPSCTIHTVDSDLVQLATDTCLVMQAGEPKDHHEEAPSHLVALYKSIVGDPTDEYPGMPGMGKAKWKSLVAAYGIDGMEELDQIAKEQNVKALKDTAIASGDTILQRIAEQPYHWFVQYELARLHPEWCYSNWNNKLISPKWFKRLPNRDRVMGVLEATYLTDLLPDIEEYLPTTILVTKDNESLLYETDLMDDMSASIVAFDYESYDTNQYQNFAKLYEGKKGEYVDVLSQKITGASFTWGVNLQKTIYICFGHKNTNNCDISVLTDVLAALPEHKVVQNSSFEGAVTRTNLGGQAGKTLLPEMIDTKIFSSYVDENSYNGLKPNAKQWLNYDQATYKETVGDKGDMSQLTGEEVFHYGADDAYVTAHLWSLFNLITRVEGTNAFCYENEFTTDRVFLDAYMEGCPINYDRLEKMATLDQRELDVLWPNLRGLLETNCTEVNREGTDRYAEDIRAFEIAKMKDSEKTDEEIANKLAEKTATFEAASKYEPYTTEFVPYQFKPTITQLNAAIIRLGFSGPDNEEGTPVNHMASVAMSRVTEWAMNLTSTWSLDDGTFELSEQAKKFVSLVTASAHQFKVREGAEYEELTAFMQELFRDKGKEVTHGDELNLDSPPQMAAMFYGKLDLPIRVRTKVNLGDTRDRLGFAGGPAANDKAIETALAEDCQDSDDWKFGVLSTVRQIKKLMTRFKFYYNPYPLWKRPDDGRIHPSVINCGTVTRRPAGSSPNILQVAKGKIRSLYLPLREDHVLIAPDFSGQELRILGSESKDPQLLAAYLEKPGKDIHSLTGSAILPEIARKKRPEIYRQIEFTEDGKAQKYSQFNQWRDDQELGEFTNWVRNKRAKGCNFLVNYEGGAGTLSTNIMVPRNDAQAFIDGMFNLYTGIAPFQKESHDTAAKYGRVWTAYGNVRHMTSDILSRDDGLRMRMERQSSNFRIQGCAADILKVVVSQCRKTGLLDETESFILAPVYDEVVCSVPIDRATEFCQRLQEIMNVTPPGHAIPMVSEFSVGYDWFNMVEIGEDTSEDRVTEALAEAKVITLEFDKELDKEVAAL